MAPPPPPTPSVPSALRPEWLAASADDARRAADAAGDRAPALVDAWIAARNAAAVAAVANDDGAPPAVRKAAKKGVWVLKARGVPIPERTVAARMPASEEATAQAWWAGPDAAGSASVVVATRRAGEPYRFVTVLVRDGVWIADVSGGEAGWARLESFFETSRRERGAFYSPVPVEWARSRVASARAEHARSGTALPLGLDRFADLLGPVPGAPPPHPVDGAGVSPVPDAFAAASASASLHGEPEFAGWLPDPAALQEMLVRVGQDLGPEGAKDADRVNASLRRAMDESTDRYFTPELRALVATRMKDVAISVLARAGADRAREVVTAAEAVRSAGLVTNPPRDVPFLRAFFAKALDFVASQSGGRVSIPVPVAPGGEAEPAEPTAARPTT